MSIRGPGRLPDFVVIGAPKAGTSSLHYYLSFHPGIHVSKPKEPCFFSESPPLGKWHLGLDWYRGLFRTDKPVCGEASTEYARWPAVPGVMEKMQPLLPGAKLIYLLREPFERLKSHYRMDARLGIYTGSFAAWVKEREDRILCSCYGTQLRHVLEFYPRDRILLVETAELKERREACLRVVFNFLGVDPSFTSAKFNKLRNEGRRQPQASPTGIALARSRPMRWLHRALPMPLYWRLERLLQRPFLVPAPDLTLPWEEERRLKARLRAEVDLVRELSGLPLPSLEVPPLPGS